MKRTRKTSSRVKAAMLAAGCTLAAVGVAEAALIAINFEGTGYGAGAAVTADAFGVATADWTNQDVGNAAGSTTVDGVGFTWTANNDWSQGDFVPAPGDTEVTFGYIDDSGDNGSLTITGLSAWMATDLSATGYTIQLIQGTDNGTGFSDTAVSDISGGALLYTLVNSVVGTGGAVGGATDVSSSLTSDTLFVEPGARAGTVRATISGVIIETIPEPATLGLVAVFGGGIFFIRRRLGL